MRLSTLQNTDTINHVNKMVNIHDTVLYRVERSCHSAYPRVFLLQNIATTTNHRFTTEFCWCKVLLPACHCSRQPAHSDYVEDTGVLLNSVICVVSVPCSTRYKQWTYLITKQPRFKRTTTTPVTLKMSGMLFGVQTGKPTWVSNAQPIGTLPEFIKNGWGEAVWWG